MNIENALRAKLIVINDLESVADNSRLGKLMKKSLKDDRKNVAGIIELLEIALERKFPGHHFQGKGVDIFDDYTFTINIETKDNFQEGIKNNLNKVRICQ